MNKILKIIVISFVLIVNSSYSKAEEYGIHAVVISDEFTGRFVNPLAIFYDEAKERLYVADSGNGRLISFDSNLEYLSEWSNKEVVSPVSIARNSNGKFYALDSSDRKVKYIDPGLGVVRPLEFNDIPKGKVLFIPGRIAIGADNSLYVIDKMNKRIVVLGEDEKYIKSYTVKGKKFGEFYGFNDLAVSHNGTVVAVDTIGRSVYVFSSEGTVKKKFGGPAYSKGGGSLFFPVSVSVDKSDNIYILDSHRGKVVVYDSSGNLKFDVSNRGFTVGSLHDPVHIVLDGRKRIYTLETGRVQILKRLNE